MNKAVFTFDTVSVILYGIEFRVPEVKVLWTTICTLRLMFTYFTDIMHIFLLRQWRKFAQWQFKNCMNRGQHRCDHWCLTRGGALGYISKI